MNNNIWVENIDCIKFLKKLPDKSIDLILTDPPFGINEKQFDAKIITIGYDVWHPYSSYFNIAEIEFKELLIEELNKKKNEK